MTRTRRNLALALAAALTIVLGLAPGAGAASPGSETVWANGQAWTMLTPHAIDDPDPQLLAQAPPFYVLSFPSDGHGGWVLPTGYSPQCDPCLGVPVPPTTITCSPERPVSGPRGPRAATTRLPGGSS